MWSTTYTSFRPTLSFRVHSVDALPLQCSVLQWLNHPYTQGQVRWRFGAFPWVRLGLWLGRLESSGRTPPPAFTSNRLLRFPMISGHISSQLQDSIKAVLMPFVGPAKRSGKRT